MKIALGADHAGYALKAHLVTVLTGWGYDVVDLGTTSVEESVDYPDFGAAVRRAVVGGEC